LGWAHFLWLITRCTFPSGLAFPGAKINSYALRVSWLSAQLPRGRSGRARESIVTVESIVIFLLIGAVAGWLAGQIVKGGGFGLVGDIVVGIVGAFVAGLLLPRLGLGLTGIVGSIVYATIGAIILLVVIRLIKRA
jgi:uncharacterized membrane protein YeaQ/YmgE (transglycosylase-associated protein family)